MTEQKNSTGADMEAMLLCILKSHPSGVTQNVLTESLPNLAVKDLAQLLNTLLGQGKINLLQKGKQLVYAFKNEAFRKSQGTDNEEKLILEAVTKAGNNGTTAKELKYATNLPQPQITKLIKIMEGRKLVKTVKSSKGAKLILLYGLDPSHTVTGGTFYSGQEFETEFVDVIGDQCYRFLLQAKGLADKLLDPLAQKHASFKSSRDVCDYINSLQISKVELKLPDIEKILEALIYDDKIEKTITLTTTSTKASGTEKFYRIIKPLLSSAGLVRMPCGVCPVYKECGKSLEVSPATCDYLKEWLEF